MKLKVLLAVCFTAINADKVYINNNGYYWKDWNVKEAIPTDAIPGSICKTGHETVIARAVNPTISVIVPGKASPTHQKMSFEFDNLEHESTQAVSILCSLNHNRFHWVQTEVNDLVSDVEKDQKVLIIGGHDLSRLLLGGKLVVPKFKLEKSLLMT